MPGGTGLRETSRTMGKPFSAVGAVSLWTCGAKSFGKTPKTPHQSRALSIPNASRSVQRRRRGIFVDPAAQKILQLRRSDIVSEYAAPTELGFWSGVFLQRCRAYGARGCVSFDSLGTPRGNFAEDVSRRLPTEARRGLGRPMSPASHLSNAANGKNQPTNCEGNAPIPRASSVGTPERPSQSLFPRRSRERIWLQRGFSARRRKRHTRAVRSRFQMPADLFSAVGAVSL